jgi:hypothetical protein
MMSIPKSTSASRFAADPRFSHVQSMQAAAPVFKRLEQAAAAWQKQEQRMM